MEYARLKYWKLQTRFSTAAGPCLADAFLHGSPGLVPGIEREEIVNLGKPCLLGPLQQPIFLGAQKLSAAVYDVDQAFLPIGLDHITNAGG